MLVILFALLTPFQFAPSSATLQTFHHSYKHSHCGNTNGNFPNNNTYYQNLIALFNDITSPNSKITNGFYNFSYGDEPNTVYAMGYCRGDVVLDDCRSCFKNATTNFLRSCPNKKEGVGYYDKCVLRYKDQSIYGVKKLDPTYVLTSKINRFNQNDFTSALFNLLGSLVSKTVEGNSTLKFAINKVNVSTSVTIYALTQCSPDLSQLRCHDCLSSTIYDLPLCCQSYQAVRFFRPSCNIRYQVYSFSDAFDTPPTPAASKGNRTSSSIFVAVAVVVAVTIVCSSLVVVIYFCLRRGRRQQESAGGELEEEDGITRLARESLHISYGDVTNRTQGFSEANKLGRSGFGRGSTEMRPHFTH